MCLWKKFDASWNRSCALVAQFSMRITVSCWSGRPWWTSCIPKVTCVLFLARKSSPSDAWLPDALRVASRGFCDYFAWRLRSMTEWHKTNKSGKVRRKKVIPWAHICQKHERPHFTTVLQKFTKKLMHLDWSFFCLVILHEFALEN